MSLSRTLVIVMAVSVIASLACSAGGSAISTSTPVAPTQSPTEAAPTLPAPTSTHAPTPVPKSLPEGVLFEDDFSSQGKSDDSGWTFTGTENSEWSWSANQISVSIKRQQWLSFNSPDGTFGDLGAETEAQAIGTGYAEYGIRFRAGQDNYYIFGVSTNGKYYVQKKVDGQWADTDPVSATASQYIKQGQAKNKLGVVAQGSRISLYINGFLVKTINDDSIAEGSVGVFAGTGDNDSAQVAFSRFAILTPDKARSEWGTTPASDSVQPTAAPGGGGGGGSGNGVVTVRNTFPGACQVNLWGKKDAVIRAEGNGSASKSLPPGTYGVHVAVDIGEVDLVQFTLPAGGSCVITCNATTKSVYNSCR